jgi:hypothetical protein
MRVALPLFLGLLAAVALPLFVNSDVPAYAIVAGSAICLVLFALIAGLAYGDVKTAVSTCLWLVGGFSLVLGAIWFFGALGPRGTIALALVLAIITGIMVYRRGEGLRRRREQAGLCDQCGYDLRQSFDRCPECGSDIPEDLVRRRRIAAELSRRRTITGNAR